MQYDQFAFYDNIEAWQFGPVVPNVYYYFCGYGAMPIQCVGEEAKIDDATARIVNPVIESKRVLPPWEMAAETHKKNGAWDRVYRNGVGNHCVIPAKLIKIAG